MANSIPAICLVIPHMPTRALLRTGYLVPLDSRCFWRRPALLVALIFLPISALLAPWPPPKSLAISLESEFINTPWMSKKRAFDFRMAETTNDGAGFLAGFSSVERPSTGRAPSARLHILRTFGEANGLTFAT